MKRTKSRVFNAISIMLLFGLAAVHLVHSFALATQSSITESQGNACKTRGKTKVQVESAALEGAKRNAIEYVQTYLSLKPQVQDFELNNHVTKSFSDAKVNVLSVLENSWDEREICYDIFIRAEVLPVSSRLENASVQSQLMDNPLALLTVKVWTNQVEYKAGEHMQVYLKGNKPFYGRLLYKNAAGHMLQLLPNPSRSSNYFEGSTVYQVPSKDDSFGLLIEFLHGKETLTLYASTAPLGNIETKNVGPVYVVKDEVGKVPLKTREITLEAIKRNPDGTFNRKSRVAEFAEISVSTQINP